MKRRLLLGAILFTGLIFIQALPSQARTGIATFPELAPLPLSLQLSAVREPLTVETIVDAALEFSGATDTAAVAAKEKLVALLRRFRDEVSDITAQAELGERALTFLHKNLLTTYSVVQTRVDTTVETGVYNCVSSAVLYTIIARSVGLSVNGVRTADHAFCSILANGQQVDVETTNPWGFNPGAKKEFSDSFGKVTGYSYIPPGNYRDRRIIGEKELLGLILVNRVSVYGDGRLYREALRPAVSAYTLTGTGEMRQVMFVALSNFIAWLEMKPDYAQAAAFAEAVKASFGGSVDLSQSLQNLYHNWVVSLLGAGAPADAEALLSQPATRSVLEASDWMNLSIAAVQQRAQIEAGAGGFLAAASIAGDGLIKIGRQQQLLQTYEAYMHNAFAQLYNARKTADARTVIDQGLAVYPDSSILLQDLDLVKKAGKP